MHFDDLLKEIGEFGLYQKRLYALICGPSLVLSGLLVAQVFVLGVPEHRCKLPGYNGTDTWEVQDSYHKILIDQTIPASEDYEYDRCNVYVTDHVTFNLSYGPINGTKRECTEWVYDTSVYRNTFAKQMNYVCAESIKISHAQMIFFSGVLVGSLVFGQLSDFIGRKKTLYIVLLLLLGSSVALAWAPNYVAFVILMFLIGASCLGTYMTTYVIGMELVGPSKRALAGNINPMFLTTGQLYLLLMVYLIRDWKYFMLAISLPSCLFLPYWWLVPESARWLLSRGKTEQVKSILVKAAKVNKTQISEKAFDNIEDDQPPKGRVWQLFSTKVLAIWTTIIFFNWFVVSLSYYGAVLNIGNLGGNIYLNFLLMAVVEYPSKIFTLFAMDKIGRKKLYIGFMVTGGLACAATIIPILYKGGLDSLHTLLIALSLLGKMCIVGGFQCIYVLSAEIFPTVVRNSGLGTGSACARVGSMIAPYVAKSADIVGGAGGKAIPQTLFGVLALIAGLLCLALPETLNNKLPDTIEDANNIRRKNNGKENIVLADSKRKDENGTANMAFEAEHL